MSKGFVLLTGATGHVGYANLIEALKKGYKVRAAVRSESKAAQVKSAKSTQPYLDQLTFTTVPDIEKEGAFDEAVKGVDYIIHTASPLPVPSDDDEKNIIRPAINGTLSILRSALKEPSIKKVVITSSVAAVVPSEPGKAPAVDYIEADPKGPYPDTFAAYAASKKLTLYRTYDFIRDSKPKFSIINVMPTFVIGRNELATTPQAIVAGSNALALGPILGNKSDSPMPSFVCHIDDVAFVHVAALDPKVTGNQNFGVNYTSSTPINWDDGIEIVKKHFPKEVEAGVFPLGGTAPSVQVPFDASKTEETLGLKFKDFEEQIVNLASWYAQAVANEK
ncbi:uncharacterized protein Z520_07405 [Fonsecaea multimorphosa CBS 102226]|uniref:NAD-dependent epimerase/dehydratase domain-containing protein n=1 Tax=Fonsecaea multimorphosa CBS 102226 TaxID=1442371 RepID=A0A0D2II17_9EURO|nr:uncharacterized protein Z520_07405 [Fonsecaea multimorphosa CBS 102226]KIX96686.1 hypothetical protein Z520_07405 [Fonsecaea multimorphosa CBS 102226]OAL20766.1 hypothetical protein AYO22_08775 [Fonsecaea multimorphosa]